MYCKRFSRLFHPALCDAFSSAYIFQKAAESLLLDRKRMPDCRFPGGNEVLDHLLKWTIFMQTFKLERTRNEAKGVLGCQNINNSCNIFFILKISTQNFSYFTENSEVR